MVGDQRPRNLHLPVLPDVHPDHLSTEDRLMAHEHEHAEWGRAVSDLSEFDYAPYDDPQTYADTMSLDGVRWP